MVAQGNRDLAPHLGRTRNKIVGKPPRSVKKAAQKLARRSGQVWQDLQRGVQEVHQLAFGQRADFGGGTLAVFKHHQRGNAAHAELGGGLLVFIDVQLHHFQLALVFGRHVVENRGIILQGPHQGAQKSSNTGTSDFRTSASKAASEVWRTKSLIGVSFRLDRGMLSGKDKVSQRKYQAAAGGIVFGNRLYWV